MANYILITNEQLGKQVPACDPQVMRSKNVHEGNLCQFVQASLYLHNTQWC